MIRDFYTQHGVTVVQGWGMTEMSPLGTVSTLRHEMESLPRRSSSGCVRSRGTASSASR